VTVTTPPAPRRHLGVFLTSALIVLTLDVVTKAWISAMFTLHEDRAVLGEWLRLTYVRNSGAAFGLFSGGRWPLIVAAGGASVAVAALMSLRPVRLAAAIPLGLVLGGALGNLIDRIRIGEVIDFINMGVGEHRWPVFNLADTGVTLGVALLALALIRGGGPSWAPPREESGAGLASPGDGV